MKVLFIGGTGNISRSSSELVLKNGHELFLLHRGTRTLLPAGAKSLKADINDLETVKSLLKGHHFDVVVN